MKHIDQEQADDCMKDTINALRREVERLKSALIHERDEAQKWDGIGTVNRINKVLEGN